MPEEPRERDGGGGHAFCRGERVDQSLEPALTFIPRCGEQVAFRERAPRHRGDFFADALIERPVIEALERAEADLHLIRDERHAAVFLERRDLRWPVVAHAKFPHLSIGTEPGKCRGNLGRIAEEIRAVQHQQIHEIHAEAAERLLHARDDVRG